MKNINRNFALEIGDIKDLKGNAVVYWNVKQKTAEENAPEKAKPVINLLAVNFVISVFPFDDNLVTATFPPVGFEDREEFMLYIKQSKCDLIYAGDIAFNKDLEDFKNLPDEEYFVLNKNLEEYMERYRERLDNIVIGLSLKEKIYLLKKMVISFRNAMKSKSKTIKIPVNINRIRKLITDMKQYYNPFDLENFNSVIPMKGKSADKMVQLYFQKFISIFYEDYESASEINTEIEKLQEKMNRIND